MYYNNTNLAYEIEPEENSRKTTAKKIKKKKRSGLVALICTIYIVASITSLLFKTANVNEKKIELENVKKEYEQVVNENKKLEVSLNSEVDLRKVEDIAIARLNMNKPRSNQIIYVNTNPVDYGEIINEEKETVREEKNRGFFGSIIRNFTGIFAYSD